MSRKKEYGNAPGNIQPGKVTGKESVQPEDMTAHPAWRAEYLENYIKCGGCPYHFAEINQCMAGEDDVPENWDKKCMVEMKEQEEGT